MQKIILPDSVKTAVAALNSKGHRADIVGGCVRDFLLSKTAYDYDITTDATPDEMLEIFKDFRTVKTGLKHGTLTVIIDAMPLEITTYRRDGDYKDHRHPERVEFTGELAQDLARRDFTVNAICYNERDGFTDLYGGIEDIRLGIIRAVGDPYRRFDEDSLRIMRAVRFAATLGFTIDGNTAAAANDKRALLSAISGERIYAELKKLLAGSNAYRVLDEYAPIVCSALGIESYTLPSEEGFARADFYARFFSLFAGLPESISVFLSVCERLRVDNKLKKYGFAVLSNLEREMTDRISVKLAMRDLGADAAMLLVSCLALLGKTGEEVLTAVSDVIAANEPYTVSMLAVNGCDATMAGLVGTDVGAALASALEEVIYARLSNEREELLAYLKSYTPHH